MGGHTLLIGPNALASIYVLLQGGDVSAAQRAAVYLALFQARRPTATWTSPRPGFHIVDGQPIDCSLIGLDVAFCAVGAPDRRVVRALDFAAPGAARPENAVRNALQRAVAVLRPVHAGLADAVATISIKAGFVVYRPNGAIDIEVKGPADSLADKRLAPTFTLTRRAGMADDLSFNRV